MPKDLLYHYNFQGYHLKSIHAERDVASLSDDNNSTCEGSHLVAKVEVEQISSTTESHRAAVVHIYKQNVQACNSELILGYKKNVTNSVEIAENSVRVIKCDILAVNSAEGMCTFVCRCEGTCTLYLINKGLLGSSHSKICEVGVS